MAIPDYETLMLPLLKIAAETNGQEVPLIAAVDKLANQFKLTDDERRELLPSGGTFKFSSRASWARTYLQKAGLLEATKRGHFRISDRGLSVLKSKPDRIDTDLLSQFEEFREFQGRKKDRKSEKGQTSVGASETPIESMATHTSVSVRPLRQRSLKKLRSAVRNFSNDL
jgi:restriction system protein